VVNGASIPSAFWTFIGGPFEGKYRAASVVHDVGCEEMTATWEDVHRMFYEACLCGGVDEQMAKMLYYAVYHFGPRWDVVTQTRSETGQNAEGEYVVQRVAQRRTVRRDPPPPTLEELERVEEFIVEENPDLSAIVQTDREVLRQRPRRGLGRGRMMRHPVRPASSGGGEDRPGNGRSKDSAARYESRTQLGAGLERAPANGDSYADPGTRRRAWVDIDDLQHTRRPGASFLPTVTEETRQRSVAEVRAHILRETGQDRPTEYYVERDDEGIRVFVEYLEVDEQGQPTGKVTGRSTVRLGPTGEVAEMISGP
jgi:hypothetical protein